MKIKKMYIVLIILLLFFALIINNKLSSKTEDLSQLLKIRATEVDFKYLKETNETIFSVNYEWEWLEKPPIKKGKFDVVRFTWSEGFIKSDKEETNSYQHITYNSPSLEQGEAKVDNIEGYNNGIVIFPQNTTDDYYPLKGNGNITIKKKDKDKDVAILISYIRDIETEDIGISDLSEESNLIKGITIKGEKLIVVE